MVVCLLAVTATALAVPASRPTLAVPSSSSAWLPRIDELRLRSRGDSALALIARALPEAEAAADTTLLLGLWLRQGELLSSLGFARQGEPVLRKTIDLSIARGDSATACAAIRWLSVAVGSQGKTEEALDLYHRLLALAQLRGDGRHEGWARVGLGWDAEIHGRNQDAIDHYERACEKFTLTGERRGEVWARNGLGNALAGVGRYADARESYRRSEETAALIGYEMAQCLAANNLGKLEYALGDPGAAMARFGEVIRIHSRIGNIRESIIPNINLAICGAELGSIQAASDSLESMLRICDREGYSDLRGMVLNNLAQTRILQGRARDARSLYRQTLALGTSAHMRQRISAVAGLAGLLDDADSSAVAQKLLDEALLALPDGSDPEGRVQIQIARGRSLLRSGRSSSAIPALRDAEGIAARLQLAAYREESLILLGRAHVGMERPDSACAAWERAAGVWEVLRGAPADPEWREVRGGLGRSLCTDLIALSLDGGTEVEGIGPVYDRAQRFKARTLLERMSGPTWSANELRHIPSLQQIQREVLGDGELLLDFFLGPSHSYLFAITRDSCRVSILPPEGELDAAARLYQGILQAPRFGMGVDGGVERVASHLGARLFGSARDLMQTSRRILLCPDGALNLLPLESLGEAAGSGAEWSRIPSVAIMGQIRSRPAGHSERPAGILALANETAPSGRLQGVLDEVGELSRRYKSTEARFVTGRDTIGPADLARVPAVLHIACHAEGNDERPWLSVLHLGARGLRAGQIASAEIPARLAVLSSCQTQHARVLSGEGVLGLSTAFLSAGTDCVVATLWPVEDRVTARLMRTFYNGIASGLSVAGALKFAQGDLRANPATAHPFYWAGFVTIGRGECTVPISRRPWILAGWEPGIIVSALGFLALAAGLAATGAVRRKRRR